MIIRHNIGDKVIALNNNENNLCQFRVKGTVYIVIDCMYCIKCGVQSINIGERTEIEEVECDCGYISKNNGKFWTDSKYFANVNNIEEALSEAIKEEDYEFASSLRDLKYEKRI